MDEEERIEEGVQNESTKDGRVLRRLRSKNTAQWGLGVESKKKRTTSTTKT